jgi:hypothetical protein
LTLGSTGIVTIANLNSAGVVHTDSSGNLTTSLVVNADIATAAAIAVSKLAAGTTGQLLLNTSTPTPTWTTMAGDATIAGTGTVNVQGLQGKSLNSSLSSIGSAQDGYALTWDNTDGYWKALPTVVDTVPVTNLKTASYTATVNDYIIAIGTISSSITITLPTSPKTGKTFVIKTGASCYQFVRNDAGSLTTVGQTVTITPASGTIDGQTSWILSTPYDSATVIYNGSEWSLC